MFSFYSQHCLRKIEGKPVFTKLYIIVIIQVLTAFFHTETKFLHLKSLAKGRIPALMSSSLIKEGLFEAPPERGALCAFCVVCCLR